MDYKQESWLNCKILGNFGWFYRFPRPNGDHLGFSDFYGSDFDRIFFGHFPVG